MDIHDIKFLIQDIKKKMPTYSDSNAVIPMGFTSRLPKNFKDFSDIKYDKFLNNHLSEIDEAISKNYISDYFKNWFSKQETKHNSDITSKDGIFSKIKQYIELDMKSPVLACGFIINPSRFTVPVVAGDEIISAESTSSSGAGSNNSLVCSKDTTVTSVSYNQIATSVVGFGAGNINNAIYDDGGDGNTVNNLLSETGSITMPNGFTYGAIPQFTMTTATFYFANIYDNAGVATYYQDGGFGTGTYQYNHSITFTGTLPDTPSMTKADNLRKTMKIKFV